MTAADVVSMVEKSWLKFDSEPLLPDEVTEDGETWIEYITNECRLVFILCQDGIDHWTFTTMESTNIKSGRLAELSDETLDDCVSRLVSALNREEAKNT